MWDLNTIVRLNTRRSVGPMPFESTKLGNAKEISGNSQTRSQRWGWRVG